MTSSGIAEMPRGLTNAGADNKEPDVFPRTPQPHMACALLLGGRLSCTLNCKMHLHGGTTWHASGFVQIRDPEHHNTSNAQACKSYSGIPPDGPQKTTSVKP